MTQLLNNIKIGGGLDMECHPNTEKNVYHVTPQSTYFLILTTGKTLYHILIRNLWISVADR